MVCYVHFRPRPNNVVTDKTSVVWNSCRCYTTDKSLESMDKRIGLVIMD